MADLSWMAEFLLWVGAVVVAFTVGVVWGIEVSQGPERRRPRRRRLRAFARGYLEGVGDERRRWETSMRTPQ